MCVSNSPYQHTSSYACTKYLYVPAYAYLAQQQDLLAYPEDGNRYPDTFIPGTYLTCPCPLMYVQQSQLTDRAVLWFCFPDTGNQ